MTTSHAKNGASTSAPVATEIIQKLQTLQPHYLDLINESMNHAGYFEGKESHFKLTIVSDAFNAKRPVARHQMIYAIVSMLLTAQGGTVHALAIHAYTPVEWQGDSPDSPNCAGQNK